MFMPLYSSYLSVCTASILLCGMLWTLSLPAAFAQTGTYTAGEGTGASLTTGTFNTAVGDSAATQQATNDGGTYLGFGAGKLDIGQLNTLLGYRAGYLLNNTGSINNLYVGYIAGASAALGNPAHSNVFIGELAGTSNVGGDQNTLLGADAGQENTTGTENTFIGEASGEDNTSGSRNTFAGNGAGKSSSARGTGSQNTAIGLEALFDRRGGFRNTALGHHAGRSLDEGHNNTFLGVDAGLNTEDAGYNTFIGALAGEDNDAFNQADAGMRNTYVGFITGDKNTFGSDNVGMGTDADFVTVGSLAGRNERNILIGVSTRIGLSNSFGAGNVDNVILGYGAKAGDADGSVAVGSGAEVAGDHGIAIGYQAKANASNSIALGNATTVGAANEVFVGNLATTSIGGIVNWTATSDARLKTDVRRDVPGLSFIRRLRPVQYRLDADSLRALAPSTDLNEALVRQGATWQTGFLAQDVAEAARAEGFAFSGIVSPVAGRRHFGLRYAAFVAPLTQAVQELDAETHHLQTRLTTVEQLVVLQTSQLTRQREELQALDAALAHYEQRIRDLLGLPPTASSDTP